MAKPTTYGQPTKGNMYSTKLPKNTLGEKTYGQNTRSFQNAEDYSSITNTVATGIDIASTKDNGSVNVAGKVASGALKGAAAGAPFAAATMGLSVAAGALIGGTVSGFSASKTNKRIANEERDTNDRIIRNRENMYGDYSNNIYKTYPSQGITGTTMYAKYGGRLPKYAKGGLMPITNTVSQAVGDKHGMDTDMDGREGVPVMDANGNQKAELENKEIKYNDALGNEKVLSQELGTADAARQIMSNPNYLKSEGLFEKKVNNINKQLQRTIVDKFTIGTNQERLRGVKHPLDGLYAEQERLKAQLEQSNTNTSQSPQPQMMRKGGMINPSIEEEFYDEFDNYSMSMKPINPIKNESYNVDKVEPVKNVSIKLPKSSLNITKKESNKVNVSDFAPTVAFLDNAYNAYVNTKRPQVPLPELAKALPLNTKINVEPQIIEGRNALNTLYRNIDQTTDNNQIGRANKIAAMTSTLKQVNSIQGNKINQETNLSNRNLLNNQEVINQNASTMNNYNMNKMFAKDDILVTNSENLANAVDKANMLIRERNLKERDKQTLQIILAKYKSNGVLTRAEIDFVDELSK